MERKIKLFVHIHWRHLLHAGYIDVVAVECHAAAGGDECADEYCQEEDEQRIE